ncbi:ectoderm-expressed 3 isoform X2 [Choristoneura fumiferana]|uniref:ectoderm-expressed 3 isoform X2 n=1 Tax=Choristoneura fumiferana TaxID=7141 RepID=UPI003D15B93A
MRVRGCWVVFQAVVACSLILELVQAQGPSLQPSVVQSAKMHNISIVGDSFMIDGQPLHILSGSLHYFRVPAVYWKDRLHKLKAAGLNSVATYVEWSFHETEERQYSFEGDRDLAAFVRLAAEEGLHVLLRPGPYICAERDLGGLPYWLLGKYPNIRLRSTDSDFMHETTVWLEKLFEQVAPLLFGNGGPIILVQVENEYGSYGTDMAYKTQLRDIIKGHVGDNALLYTTDGTYTYMITGGAIPGTLTTIDFGATGDALKMFEDLRKYMPQGPLMNSEFYPGWLTHWGETLQTVSTDVVVHTLTDMMNHTINFNIYVFFGGSNFEFTAGANYNSVYLPDITSYDYDAPLSEAGDPTPKYLAIRDAIAKFNPDVLNIDLPTASNKGAYGTIKVTPRLGLLSPQGRSDLGKRYADVSGSKLPTFEALRQRAGYVLYETAVGAASGLLSIKRPRDRIYVYVDGKYEGVLSRTTKIFSLPLITKANSVLSLLVENQGRINYGPYLHDFKGILSEVKYDSKVLNGTWSITGFPLEKVKINTATNNETENLSIAEGPVLYESHFTIPDSQPLDTFLDPTGWGKGFIWVNGYNLGRYWPGTGPQVTLYLPGCWLLPPPTQNHLQILELEEAPTSLTLNSIDYPILDRNP